jgi:hypothetical protein
MPLLAEPAHQSWEAIEDDAGERDELTEEEIAAGFSRDITRPPLGTGMDLPWDDEEEPAAPTATRERPAAPATGEAPAAPGGDPASPAPEGADKPLPPLTPEELDGKWT